MEMKIITSYAQNREDIILAALLSGVENGFYVDVGAADPFEDSVTKYFYDRGWHGINIEPNEKMFKRLDADRSRDINLKVGVDNKGKNRTLRVYSGAGYGLSTISELTKKEYENKTESIHTKEFEDVEIETKPLREIFKDNEVKDIDFLKIDVEGAEDEVLRSNNWAKYRPKVLCIESNHIHKDWHEFITSQGYKQVYNDGLNDYFLAEEEGLRQENFVNEYLRLAVGSHVVRPKISAHIDSLEAKKHLLQNQVDQLNSENARMQNEIKRLQSIIDFPPGVLASIKLLLRSINVLLRKIEAQLRRKAIQPRQQLDVAARSGNALLDVRLYDYSQLDLNPKKNMWWFIIYKLYSRTVAYSRSGAKWIIYKLKKSGA